MLREDHSRAGGLFVYVDNSATFCSREEEAAEVVEKWTAAFEADQLLLHKPEISSRTQLSCVRLDGEDLSMQVTVERLLKVRAAVEGVLSRRKVCGWVVEVVVGHLTFTALACRGILLALHTVCQFMQEH